MTVFRIIIRISELMDTFTSWIGMVFLSLMFVILLLQVFFRYVLNNSLPWPEEIAVILLVWSAFIGASIALKKRLHVSIVVFIDMLPKKIKPISLLVVDLLVGLFSGYLMIYGWAIAEFVGARQKTPFTDIPYFYLYLSVAAGGLLLLIHSLVLIVDDLVSVLGIEE